MMGHYPDLNKMHLPVAYLGSCFVIAACKQVMVGALAISMRLLPMWLIGGTLVGTMWSVVRCAQTAQSDTVLGGLSSNPSWDVSMGYGQFSFLQLFKGHAHACFG